MWLKSRFWGWTLGTAFALFGIAKKDSVQTGWRFFPDPSEWLSGDGDFRRLQHDWTIYPEGEKGWIAGTRIGDKAKSSTD